MYMYIDYYSVMLILMVILSKTGYSYLSHRGFYKLIFA